MARMTLTLTSAALCMACVMLPATVTHAAPQADTKTAGASGTPSFGEVDKNHDGKVVRSEIPKDVEALKQLRTHFREADQDGNGSLSEQEYQQYLTANTSSGI